MPAHFLHKSPLIFFSRADSITSHFFLTIYFLSINFFKNQNIPLRISLISLPSMAKNQGPEEAQSKIYSQHTKIKTTPLKTNQHQRGKQGQHKHFLCFQHERNSSQGFGHAHFCSFSGSFHVTSPVSYLGCLNQKWQPVNPLKSKSSIAWILLFLEILESFWKREWSTRFTRWRPRTSFFWKVIVSAERRWRILVSSKWPGEYRHYSLNLAICLEVCLYHGLGYIPR